jgi:diaminohydroxyphosphoribosylaminopyrimidine deaminase/5-amino-6-(5-phosphoribosylamino)uracil reductase
MSHSAINFSYLHRALHLAKLAEGTHFPNPQVGAVIVHNNRIIGEGYHKRAGEAHAEVEAVRAVEDYSLLSESTIYVTLEPCSYFGRTPACVDLILKHNIPRVVVGCLDPNPKVSGKGIARLRAQGVEVHLTPDPKPFEELINWFRVNQLERRAWVTVKWAESTDGFIGVFDENDKPAPARISGFETGIFTHKLRARHQAILVGSVTAEVDDPLLNTRYYPGPSPLKMLLDPERRLPYSLNVFNGGSSAKRLCFMPSGAHDWPLDEPFSWSLLLKNIYEEHGICKLLVEGGTNTIQSLLDEGLADEVIRIKSPIFLMNGRKAPSIPSYKHSSKQFFIGKDEILLLNYS